MMNKLSKEEFNKKFKEKISLDIIINDSVNEYINSSKSSYEKHLNAQVALISLLGNALILARRIEKCNRSTHDLIREYLGLLEFIPEYHNDPKFIKKYGGVIHSE